MTSNRVDRTPETGSPRQHRATAKGDRRNQTPRPEVAREELAWGMEESMKCLEEFFEGVSL